ADVASGEHVEETEDASLRPREDLVPPQDVDAGNRDVPAQPVDGEQAKRKQDALAQVRNAKNIRYRVEKLHLSSSLFTAAPARARRSLPPCRRPPESSPRRTWKT